MLKYQRECYDTNEKKYKYFFTSDHPECNLKIAYSYTVLSNIESVIVVYDSGSGWYSVKANYKDEKAENYCCWWSPLDFHDRDGHFGSFLWDEYGKKGEEKMAISASITNAISGVAKSATEISNNFAATADALKVKGYDYSTADVAWSGMVDTNTDWVSYNHISTAVDTNVYAAANANDVLTLKNKINELEIKINDKTDKENNKMKFNLDFGKLNNKSIGLSLKGPCVKNTDGNWVVYDNESKEVIAVDGFTLEKGEDYLYKMPVALKDIKKGDMLLHNTLVVFVEEINTEEESKKIKSLVVVSPVDGEVKEIVPTKNMFNFEYMTKIVNVLDMFAEKPSADNPFGNMLPFLMMKDGAKNFKDIALMQILMNGKELSSFNPMFLLLDDNKDIDPLMLMMMTNMNK
jgi:hypothetical protein